MANRLLYKIASPIIIVGVFIIFVFFALNSGTVSVEIYGIFALVVVFIFLFGFAIGQKFTSPLEKLLDKVRRLSQGEFTSRIYLETKDEFEELARSFNKIAEDLEKSQEQAREAESMADVRVRAKTRELGEEIVNLEDKVKNRAEELQRMMDEVRKLQDLAKNREEEVVKLRKEIADLRVQPRSAQNRPAQPSRPQPPPPSKQAPTPRFYQ
jgi:methyl-accepting chemotaxis protein